MTSKMMATLRAVFLIRKFRRGYVPELDTSTARKKEQSVNEIILYGLYKLYPKKTKLITALYSRLKIEVI